MNRAAIKKAWEIVFRQWQLNEEDRRDPIHDLPVEFTVAYTNEAIGPYLNAIRNTTQALIAMSGDPMLPKDQRYQLKQLIDANQALLSAESEMSHVN